MCDCIVMCIIHLERHICLKKKLKALQVFKCLNIFSKDCQLGKISVTNTPNPMRTPIQNEHKKENKPFNRLLTMCKLLTEAQLKEIQQQFDLCAGKMKNKVLTNMIHWIKRGLKKQTFTCDTLCRQRKVS